MQAQHERVHIKSSSLEYDDMDVAADRIANFSNIMVETFRSGSAHIEKKNLGHSDAMFMLEALLCYTKDQAINAVTPEKKKQLRRLKSKMMFLDTVTQHGGVLSSAESAKILGVSKVTVMKKKDQRKLLALNIDGEFHYPVFQFTDEIGISEKGILKGVAELLPLLNRFSDRLQYSFFMEPRNTVLNGVTPKNGTFTVAELLRNGATEVVMQELFRLARLYGSQDAA